MQIWSLLDGVLRDMEGFAFQGMQHISEKVELTFADLALAGPDRKVACLQGAPRQMPRNLSACKHHSHTRALEAGIMLNCRQLTLRALTMVGDFPRLVFAMGEKSRAVWCMVQASTERYSLQGSPCCWLRMAATCPLSSASCQRAQDLQQSWPGL
jgi:hypothetical protein